MSREVLVLDLGSQKVLALWGRITAEDTLEVLNVGIQDHQEAFRFGEVNRPEEALEAVERALQKALGKHRKKLKSLPVHVAVSGRLYTTKWVKESDNISKAFPVTITEQNVRDLIHIVLNEPETDGRIIFQFYPFVYRLDKSQETQNPVGMHARSLEVEGLAVYARTVVFRNLEELLYEAGIPEQLLTFEYQPVAASWAVLSKGDRRENLLVLDIGHAKVDYALWLEGGLRLAGSIGNGCRQAITYALAQRFEISWEKAGELLSRLGNLLDPSAEPQTLELSLGGQGIQRKIPRQKALREVHQELDRMVQRLQEFIGRTGRTVSGVVVVGGMAQLPGLLGYLEEKFQKTVNLGVIRGVQNLPGNGDPSLAVAAGTLKLVKERLVKPRRRKRTPWGHVKELLRNFF